MAWKQFTFSWTWRNLVVSCKIYGQPQHFDVVSTKIAGNSVQKEL